MKIIQTMVLVGMFCLGLTLSNWGQSQNIRSEQERAAKSGEVRLAHFKKGASSSTALRGVPLELRDIIIYDERDLQVFLEGLAPYYGFNGPEFLRYAGKDVGEFSTVYTAYQWIDGHSSTTALRIWVNNKTAKVSSVDGALYSTAGLEKKHMLTKAAAERRVLEFLTRKAPLGEPFTSVLGEMRFKLHGKPKSEKIYKNFGPEMELRLWWEIGIELESPVPFGRTEFTHDWYYVDPEGNVTPLVEGGFSHGITMVCDGRGTTSPWCSDSPTKPTVLNHAGMCQPGYSCPPTSAYRIAHDTAAAVEDMWDDLVSGVNGIGANNSAFGGDLEINVGGYISSGADGSYVARKLALII